MTGVAALTLVHTAISLVGIFSGLGVLALMLERRDNPRWTSVFLITTVLTSVTGYFFPFTRLLPSHVVGAVSLIVLAVVLYARYGRAEQGRWAAVFVLGSVLALWLNVFVLVAQLFAKVPALHALAPTQTEPPFGVTQLAVLAVFVVLGYRAVRRGRVAVAGARAAP
ncbi:MAG TPA: hypothetical protein VFD38_20785 [Myxococcaceae bacterium]|nr:hypothetical protein [Myxococcaceae bacterium]